MSFYAELDQANLTELMAYFQQPPPDGEDGYSYYVEVATLIGQQGEAGIAFLKRQRWQIDQDKLRAIIFALSYASSPTPDLLSWLVDLLKNQHANVVAEAIDGLTHLKAKEVAGQVLPLYHHDSPYVKGSVLRFMGRLQPDKALPILIEALHDPHFIVRENAVDELGEYHQEDIITCLRPLLADPHPDVRQATKTAIYGTEMLSFQRNISSEEQEIFMPYSLLVTA